MLSGPRGRAGTWPRSLQRSGRGGRGGGRAGPARTSVAAASPWNDWQVRRALTKSKPSSNSHAYSTCARPRGAWGAARGKRGAGGVTDPGACRHAGRRGDGGGLRGRKRSRSWPSGVHGAPDLEEHCRSNYGALVNRLTTVTSSRCWAGCLRISVLRAARRQRPGRRGGRARGSSPRVGAQRSGARRGGGVRRGARWRRRLGAEARGCDGRSSEQAGR